MAMTVKVPEYAPWAPHGYARMIEVLEMKEMEASSRLSTLNAILTTMRLGNLAEPEDLEPLQAAIVQAQQQPATKARKEAIAYAEMVISYVTDGSGTPDMIRRAIEQLKESK